MVMHQVFCVYVIADSLAYFVGLLIVAVGVYLNLLTAHSTLFLPICCLLRPQYKDFHLHIYLVLCCLAVIFWRPDFLKRKIEWEWICGRGEVGATKRSGGRGNCAWGVKKKKKR